MKLQSLLVVALAAFQISEALPFEPLRILQIADDTTITVLESEKLSLKRSGMSFIDITNHIKFPFSHEKLVANSIPRYNYPTEALNRKIVESLTSQIDKDSMYNDLAEFTSFYTRYYKSEYGYQSAQWLEERLLNVTSEAPKGLVTIEQFHHSEWKQYSIIVKIKGSESPENIIVMGSHQDSINLLLPSVLAAPGADDDGSGTVTNLEALRIYVEHYLKVGYVPKNTVEFHFYSAEEGGLLGSLDVFTKYAREQKRVVAMLQQDMTGYVQDPEHEHVGVIIDYVTKELTDFIKVIIDSYLLIPYVETQCGYACSDHGSATKNGYPAAFVIESDFKKTNKYIHSTMDTLDRLSFPHMAEHSKIVLGSIIELGDWEFLELP